MESEGFTWDLGKEVLNIQKHGIDFVTASEVFIDRRRVVYIDFTHSVDEIRYFCIGQANGRIATVRFVYRENKIRILGAGYWRKGVKIYEKENKGG